MAHVRRAVQARTSSAGNPISASITTQVADTVLVVMIKVTAATTRAGGAPTFAGQAFTQANITQLATATPEASAELWYLLNPLHGTFTLTIPNTGALTCFYTVEAGQAQSWHDIRFRWR
jgi:hypothetical protein